MRNANGQEAAVPCSTASAGVTSDTLQNFAAEWQPLEQEDLSSADYYFNSYAHFGIHEEMLKDAVRTGAYKRAILQNKHLFKDKIVLDVGSGTGILCLFAAQAGAKQVIGVECSDIVHIARKIASSNGFGEVVTYVQGKVEEVELPVKEVDIIISEWMGYFLLYESMLDTVLFARDKWLTKNGALFPDRATLHLAAIEDGEYKDEKIGYWSNVYGFDYSCVKQCVMEEPVVDVVDQQAVCTSACCVMQLNLNTCTKDDLEHVAPWKLKLERKDFVHAIIAWFDIYFDACHKPIYFTTGPFGKYTHWKQTVFYLSDVLVCQKDDELCGLIAIKKNSKNARDLDIKLSYEFDGQTPGQVQKINRTQYYRLR